ncbi:MAG: TRAP transporter small permease subunit [Alphaproteobacteria bacterium]|nr:TRAP transporter small permease subunit [Alphaproteobacteria bacterium]
MLAIIHFVESLSMWMGKAFGWCIIVLAFGIGYEVFVRYALRDPTSWAYDMSYIMYGAMFLMAGPYALARDGHVRGDVLYRLMPARVQAGLDFALYLIFYFPGVLALIYSGWIFAKMAWTFKEVSVSSPAGIPVYPLKMLIPVAGALLLLQGLAELARCVRCLRDGAWPRRLHDVEELEAVIVEQHRKAEGDRA